MKKFAKVALGIVTSSLLLTAALPAMAGRVDVDVNFGIPGVYQSSVVVGRHYYVQQQPVYFARDRYREREWREHDRYRQQWRDEHRERYEERPHDGYRRSYYDDRHDHRDHDR